MRLLTTNSTTNSTGAGSPRAVGDSASRDPFQEALFLSRFSERSQAGECDDVVGIGEEGGFVSGPRGIEVTFLGGHFCGEHDGGLVAPVPLEGSGEARAGVFRLWVLRKEGGGEAGVIRRLAPIELDGVAERFDSSGRFVWNSRGRLERLLRGDRSGEPLRGRAAVEGSIVGPTSSRVSENPRRLGEHRTDFFCEESECPRSVGRQRVDPGTLNRLFCQLNIRLRGGPIQAQALVVISVPESCPGLFEPHTQRADFVLAHDLRLDGLIGRRRRPSDEGGVARAAGSFLGNAVP